jgi:hypothetical protein
MTGKLLIDGVDVYTQWKVVVLDGGYNDIAKYPATKKHNYNEWPELNGVQYDLSSHYLQDRSIAIKIGSALTGGVDGLITSLLSSGYHLFNFVEAGIVLTLRYVSESGRNTLNGLTTLTLTLNQDTSPLSGYSYVSPSGEGRSIGLTMDNKDISLYGCSVLDGFTKSMEARSPAKKNLSTDSQYSNGIQYDGGITKVNERKIQIPLLMRGATLTAMWGYWHALLFDLVRTGARTISYNGHSYSTFYTSAVVQNFSPCNIPWLTFTLTLTDIS